MNQQMNGAAQQNGMRPNWSQMINVVYFVAHVLATLVTPIVRNKFGREGLGIYAVGAMVLLVLVAGSNRDVLPWYYFGLWVFALLYQRVATFRSAEVVHSAYGGFPELACRLFRQPKENNARNLEVVLILAAAVAVSQASQILGSLFFASVVGLVVVRCIEYQFIVMRNRRMTDAKVEYQVMQEYWRGGRNDW